jgi:hypothetical protein
MEANEQRLTILSDEDGETAYILIDDHAPTTPADALAAVQRHAPRDWGVRFTPDEAEPWPSVGEVRRQWCKWPDGDENADALVECATDDPDRDSEWWVVPSLPPQELDLRPVSSDG